jgi:Type I restriction modification DNA specificity domain
MADFVSLKDLFHIEYGNQLDKNKLIETPAGINFVSRTSSNLGVDTKIEAIAGIEPYDDGLITATLGGTYLLSAFVQPAPFYTGQNIKVLNSLKPMSFNEKVYYCLAISKNRFRYTSHGREANKTFDDILVPPFSSLPNWVNGISVNAPNKDAVCDNDVMLDLGCWKDFNLASLFKVTSSRDPLMNTLTEGATPYVSSTEYNNGVSAYVDLEAANEGNVLTINRGGSVGKTFYQESPFCATPVDVRILKPKFKLNKFIGMFLAMVIEKEKYRFNYCRKMGTDRINHLSIKLPAKADGQPDWEFMESYVKTLPYSVSL